MLLKRHVLEGIANGSISLVFRRWRKPTVKAGGSLKTAIGVLAIDEIAMIDEAAITEEDAAQAGYISGGALRAELAVRTEGALYRIRVRYAGDDPRVALRADDRVESDTLRELVARLRRFDGAYAWTSKTLDVIAAHPGRRAAELAHLLDQDKASFKANVRKLKALGLTESLRIGYRLSPRGLALRAGTAAEHQSAIALG